MKKAILSTLLCLLLSAGFLAAGQQEQDEELQAAMKELNQRYLNEDFIGKAEALEEFLHKYPETRYTLQLLRAANNMIEHELDDPARMLKLTDYVLERVADDDLKTEIMTRQIDLFIRLEMNERLLTTAKALEARKVEKFAVEEGLGHAYAAAEQWEKSRAHFKKALGYATEEALKADGLWENAGESYRDLYLRRRKTAAHAGIAKSLAGEGKLEEALKHYSIAAESANMNLYNAAEGELNYLWGKALMQVGKDAEAERTFAAAALTRRDEDSRAELLKLYTAKHGSTEGFDKYLFDFRRKLAPAFEDFSLPDYEGTQRTFADLRGSVATMVVFWHPL